MIKVCDHSLIEMYTTKRLNLPQKFLADTESCTRNSLYMNYLARIVHNTCPYTAVSVEGRCISRALEYSWFVEIDTGNSWSDSWYVSSDSKLDRLQILIPFKFIVLLTGMFLCPSTDLRADHRFRERFIVGFYSPNNIIFKSDLTFPAVSKSAFLCS